MFNTDVKEPCYVHQAVSLRVDERKNAQKFEQ